MKAQCKELNPCQDIEKRTRVTKVEIRFDLLWIRDENEEMTASSSSLVYVPHYARKLGIRSTVTIQGVDS